MPPLGQQLAGGQRPDGGVPRQVQLQEEVPGPCQSPLGVAGHRVPHPDEGDVDGAEEEGGRGGGDAPEEGALLGVGGVVSSQGVLGRKFTRVEKNDILPSSLSHGAEKLFFREYIFSPFLKFNRDLKDAGSSSKNKKTTTTTIAAAAAAAEATTAAAAE